MREAILSCLREELGDGYRLEHVLRVEEECRSLAELFSLPPKERRELSIAALLHDLTKHRSIEDQLSLFTRYGVSITEADMRSPKTLHAVTGAYLARERFPDWVSETVFTAILQHTTAAPDMSLPSKLLYLADYIEPGRTYPSCVSLRRAFYDGLPSAPDPMAHLNRILLLSLDQTIAELRAEHAYIHPSTTEAREFLLAHP